MLLSEICTKVQPLNEFYFLFELTMHDLSAYNFACPFPPNVVLSIFLFHIL